MNLMEQLSLNNSSMQQNVKEHYIPNGISAIQRSKEHQKRNLEQDWLKNRIVDHSRISYSGEPNCIDANKKFLPQFINMEVIKEVQKKNQKRFMIEGTDTQKVSEFKSKILELTENERLNLKYSSPARYRDNSSPALENSYRMLMNTSKFNSQKRKLIVRNADVSPRIPMKDLFEKRIEIKINDIPKPRDTSIAEEYKLDFGRDDDLNRKSTLR